MRFCLSLTLLCISMALCDGACLYDLFEGDKENAKRNGCVDPYDGKKHLFGSTWNTDGCLRCECSEARMTCCTRYGGPVIVEGCTAIVDRETCEYKFYKEDDPSKPCFLKEM
nr:small serum protein 2-like [Pogona vitticeps]